MAHFGCSEGSTQGPLSVAATACENLSGPLPDMEWDHDVDAFLDDYLQGMGADLPGPDQFGNFAFDFAPPVTAAPNVLGAWGPTAPAPASTAAAIPADSLQQQGATMLTSQLHAQALNSQPAPQPTATATATAPAALRRAPSEAVLQPPPRATRSRRAAGTSTPTTGSGGARSARESKKEADMKKHLALQEKNRRAQRRFRERQKLRVAELEAQVAELQTQLAAAQAGQATPAGDAAQDSPFGTADGGAAQHVAKLMLQASPKAVVDPHAPAPSSHAGSEDEAGQPAAAAEPLTLTVTQGHPLTLGAGELAVMTPAELTRHWKAYVNELAGILVESDNPGSPATQERLSNLVGEICALWTRFAICNPPGSKHFLLSKVDDASSPPADCRVPQIARALDISQPQRRQLGQLRALFLQRLGAIAAERRDLTQQLAVATPCATGNRPLASRYLAAHECARRLRDNLRQEHSLVLDFVGTVLKHVLSPSQVAQFMIQSYPWTPDCAALCTWVAAEDGDAEALAQLAAEAQSKQAAAQAGSNGSGQQGSGTSGAGASASGAFPSLGMPPPGSAPMLMPGPFSGMQEQPMFGQPVVAPPPFLHLRPCASDAMNNLLGHRWPSGSMASPTACHTLAPYPSGPVPHASGSSHGMAPPLGMPVLPPLVGSGGSVSKGVLLAELAQLPMSPNMAAISSATNT